MMGGGLLGSQLLRLIGWEWLGLVLGCLVGIWLAVRADRTRLPRYQEDRRRLQAAAERRARRNAKHAARLPE